MAPAWLGSQAETLGVPSTIFGGHFRCFWKTGRSRTSDKAYLKASEVFPRNRHPAKGSVQGAAQLLALNGWTRTVRQALTQGSLERAVTTGTGVSELQRGGHDPGRGLAEASSRVVCTSSAKVLRRTKLMDMLDGGVPSRQCL